MGTPTTSVIQVPVSMTAGAAPIVTSEAQVIQVKQIQEEVQVKKILVDAIAPYTGKQRKPSHF